MAAVALPSSAQPSLIHRKPKISFSASQLRKAVAYPNLKPPVSGISIRRTVTGAPLAFSKNTSALSVEASSEKAKQRKSPIVVIDNYDSFTYNLCQVGHFQKIWPLWLLCSFSNWYSFLFVIWSIWERRDASSRCIGMMISLWMNWRSKENSSSHFYSWKCWILMLCMTC